MRKILGLCFLLGCYSAALGMMSAPLESYKDYEASCQAFIKGEAITPIKSFIPLRESSISAQ